MVLVLLEFTLCQKRQVIIEKVGYGYMVSAVKKYVGV